MQFSEILTATKDLCSITTATYDAFLKREINFGQQHFSRDLDWSFLETKSSIPSVAYKYIYDLPSNYDVIRGITWGQRRRLFPVSYNHWLELSKYSSWGKPRYYYVNKNKIYFYPSPNEDAATTSLDGAINDTTTTITLSSVTGLKPKGRVIIENEVIDYQHINSANRQLKNCTRGEEGTTAASHADGTTVTYRNIEISYYKILTDLSADADISEIPTKYHEVLMLYASSRFFEKTEDRGMANRMWLRYLEIKNQAKRDLGEKQTQRYTTTLDDSEIKVVFKDETYPRRSSLHYGS